MDLYQFNQILLEKCALDLERPLVVGVSGGPDSLCLLDLLDKAGLPVIVAHYDHNLRPESGVEAKSVEREAVRRGLKFVLEQGNVREAAQTEGLSIEEAARQARYRFLFSQARASGAGAVAVAHHADDQVETVLMHLLRGSGLSGLKGMTYRAILPVWDSEIPLIRPLLSMWRTEILSYCKNNRLDPVMDHTNLDTRYFRNRLRHELIPSLESYNPQIREGILRMSRALAEDYELLREVIRQNWDRCLLREGEGYLVLDFELLRGYSGGLRKNMIREAIGRLRPALRDIDYEAVVRAESFILSPPAARRIELVGNLWLGLEGNSLFVAENLDRILEPDWPLMEAGHEIVLPVPGSIELQQGWSLVTALGSIEDVSREKLLESSPNEAWLDVDRLEDPLVLRTRRPGDRFQPLGMGGHSLKLADFWINERLPRRAREKWPLVCSGGRIAWVCGSRLAEPFRVTGTTRRVLHLKLLPSV